MNGCAENCVDVFMYLFIYIYKGSTVSSEYTTNFPKRTIKFIVLNCIAPSHKLHS